MISYRRHLRRPVAWMALLLLYAGVGCEAPLWESCPRTARWLPGHQGPLPTHGPISREEPAYYGYYATCWAAWPARWPKCPPVPPFSGMEGGIQDFGPGALESIPETDGSVPPAAPEGDDYAPPAPDSDTLTVPEDQLEEQPSPDLEEETGSQESPFLEENLPAEGEIDTRSPLVPQPGKQDGTTNLPFNGQDLPAADETEESFPILPEPAQLPSDNEPKASTLEGGVLKDRMPGEVIPKGALPEAGRSEESPPKKNPSDAPGEPPLVEPEASSSKPPEDSTLRFVSCSTVTVAADAGRESVSREQ